MCLKYLKIKASTPFGPRSQYVPCGYCDECRAMMRSNWSFRLRAELQQRITNEGWQAGFFTLTYNDKALPYFPQDCFKDYDPLKVVCDDSGVVLHDSFGEELHTQHYTQLKCFDKDHVRGFIHGIRKYLHAHYGIRRIVYLVAGEYGPKTQRPHYHGLIAWPARDGYYEDVDKKTGRIRRKKYRGVDARLVFELIKDFWTGSSNVLNDRLQELQFGRTVIRPNYGFVGPHHFDGKKDPKDPNKWKERPFLLEDYHTCAAYASKYCCKDMDYSKYIRDFELDYHCKKIKNHLCFHFQNRSLGFAAVQSMTDEQKLDVYMNGFEFLGDEKRCPVPVYIRNKLVFDPYYIYENGKRLVRKSASGFCMKYKDEIFKKKEEFYERLFVRSTNVDYFTCRGFTRDAALVVAKKNKEIVDYYGASALAQNYLCYYGVPFASCFRITGSNSVKPVDQWLNRYYGEFCQDPAPLDAKIVNPYVIMYIREAIGVILGSISFTRSKVITPKKLLEAKVADFHKSLPRSPNYAVP